MYNLCQPHIIISNLMGQLLKQQFHLITDNKIVHAIHLGAPQR